MGKSRLAPLKTVSIPRLELVAATMATKVDVLLRNNFGSSLSESVFWTDSMTVLYMIRNSAKRFPVFVSNRLAQIEVPPPNGVSFPAQTIQLMMVLALVQ